MNEDEFQAARRQCEADIAAITGTFRNVGDSRTAPRGGYRVALRLDALLRLIAAYRELEQRHYAAVTR